MSPADAEAYRRFVKTWEPVAQGMVESFIHAPTPLNLMRYMAFNKGMRSQASDRLLDIVRGYGQVLRQSWRAGPGSHAALLVWAAMAAAGFFNVILRDGRFAVPLLMVAALAWAARPEGPSQTH